MVARVIRTSTIASNMFVNNLIIFRICNRFLSAYKWSRSTFFEESLNSDIGINLHSFLFKSYHFFMFWLSSNLIATFLDWNYMRLLVHVEQNSPHCVLSSCGNVNDLANCANDHSDWNRIPFLDYHFFCLLFINIFLHADRV